MMFVGLAESLILLPFNVYWVVTGAGLLPIVTTIVAAKMVAALLTVALVHGLVTPLRGPLLRTVFRQLWKTTLPFGISSLIVFPSIRFDVLLLSKMATFATVGLYSAATKLMEFLFIIPMAFFLAMLPNTARDLSGPEKKTERLERSLRWYFTLVVPIGAGVIGLSHPIVRFTYGPGFEPAGLLLQIQMFAFLLLTVDVTLAMICRAAGFQQVDLAFVTACTILSIVLNLLLIPRLSAVGAGLAVAASVLFGLILRWRFVTRSVVKLDWLSFISAPLSTSVLLMGLLLLLWNRVPWPLLAIGYALAYGTVAVTRFPFVSPSLKALLQSRKRKPE